MSLSGYNVHMQRAVASWHQGRHRESANSYWEAFRCLSSPTHEARYWTLHGYTSILRGEGNINFVASDDDLNNITKIFEDKHEPILFRLEAGFTLGVVYYKRSERHKCEDVYHRAIALGEKRLKKSQDYQKMIILGVNGQEEKTMKELAEGVLKDCQDNLNELNSATCTRSRISLRPGDQPSKIHSMPIGTRGTSLTSNEINNLIDVGGIHCDCCKKGDTRHEAVRMLSLQ